MPQRPKTLYRYDLNKNCMKHMMTEECAPQVIEEKRWGTLWRCRHDNGYDFYGYGKRQEAKDEEIVNTKKNIIELQQWLGKLTKEPNGTEVPGVST
jgi:hypothetical protein